MAGKLKQFAQDSFEGGAELAAYITPPILWPVTIPVLGALLGATVVPALSAAAIGLDRLAEKRQVWKRGKIGEAEQSLRATFGDIAVKGYRYWGGGIEMNFTEVDIYNVYPGGRTDREGVRSCIHHDREQGAKDLLGNLAQGATPDGRGYGALIYGIEERFIVLRKKGETSAQFYQAARIEKPEDAPEGAITATHHYYKDPIGHGGISKERHYAITPVTPETAARLQKLGL